jgi:DNA-binding NarL/FixJ family response regulator
MMTRPRVLLADDHTMLLDAFQRLLTPTCEVVGAVSDGRSLVEAAPRLKPDVVVLDISMPLLNGMDACRQLQPRLPDTQWVFLTVNEDPDVAVEAFRLGGLGYLLKKSAAAELFLAIQRVMCGQPYITPLLTQGMPLGVFLTRAAKVPTDALTPRQREVIQLLAEGRLMKEVADILGVTLRTIAFHKYSIMKQLGVQSSAQLVQYAVHHGLVRR